MKVLFVLTFTLIISAGYSVDLNQLKNVDTKAVEEKAAEVKAAASTADAKADVGMEELTKRLKNVQNEKGPIVFKTGKAVLDTAKCETTLKAVHDIITLFPGYLVQIEGHTDNTGKASANLTLSQKRAAAVKAYLTSKYKTPAKRLTSKGFGDTLPIADNSTEDGRGKNRRVDFSVFRMK